MTKLYLAIPCYNEEKVLPLTAPMFLKKINQLQEEGLIGDDSRILFIDDGKLAAVGTHGELYETNAAYRKMVDLQKLEEEGGQHHA